MNKEESNKSYLVSGNSTKAGLPNSLDEINKRITEASKYSRYTAAQERKTIELESKLCAQKEQLKLKLSQKNLLERMKKTVDEMMKTFEEEQRKQFEKSNEICWVCVDMDAYFAAVESLDAPELKNVPMAVGSSAMLSTSNYAARKFGVSAAMPGYIAQKLCPELKIVPLRFDRYREISGQVAQVLRKYDAEMIMWSLDETFLKLKVENFEINDGKCFDFGKVVEKMREEVEMVTGLTCSAGIASNPLLAKLASNHQKPNGNFEIERANIELMREFLFKQPVRKLSGIGKVMALSLDKLFEVRTIGDLVIYIFFIIICVI